MIYIAVLNQVRFDSFIKKGLLEIRSSEQSSISVGPNDSIYIQLESDRRILGPFKICDGANPDCYVIDGSLCQYRSELLFTTGVIDKTIIDSLSSETINDIIYEDTMGVISDNPFLTGFVCRTLKYSTLTNKLSLDISSLPSNIVGRIMQLATNAGLSPEIYGSNIIIHDPSKIPLSLLFCNNACLVRQSSDFMNGYLVGSLNLIVNRRTDVNMFCINNQSVSFNISLNQPLFLDYLSDNGYIIQYSTAKQIIMSPLSYSIPLIYDFYIGCKSDLQQFEQPADSVSDPSFDEVDPSFVQFLLLDLSKWLFINSGFDFIKSLDGGFITKSGDLMFEIHIIIDCQNISFNNSSNCQIYLFWCGSEIKYYRAEPGQFISDSPESFISCLLPGLNRDLISLLNDHICTLLSFARGDYIID